MEITIFDEYQRASKRWLQRSLSSFAAILKAFKERNIRLLLTFEIGLRRWVALIYALLN